MSSNRNRYEDDRSPLQQTPRAMRLWFGIFMVLVYLGIGLLFILMRPALIFNDAVSCVVGGLLMAYGVFRGYRLYIGSN